MICKVIGQAVSTLKDQRLGERRLLVVGRLGGSSNEILDRFVALDTIGAGEGMLVGVIEGAPAMKALGRDTPMDAAIVAIFDELNIDGEKFG